MDGSRDMADGNERRDNDESVNNQDTAMQYDEASGSAQEDSGHNSNGNGSRNMDVDEVDAHNSHNEREKIHPYSNRNRNNYGGDGSNYGIRESPAVIVNTNLLPFMQKLHDPMRMFYLPRLKFTLPSIFPSSYFLYCSIYYSDYNYAVLTVASSQYFGR